MQENVLKFGVSALIEINYASGAYE